MNRYPTPESIVQHVQSIKVSRAFNPYVQLCEVHDHKESANLRSRLLRDILNVASSVNMDAIWIGRDLGYRGGRRTGLALTDDLNFETHLSRWGLRSDRPTKGASVKERTASIIWDMLNGISQNIFLWNVFPFHPHLEGEYFSNRMHNAKERQAGIQILDMLVSLLNPKKIIAIGKDAQATLARFCENIEINNVRHPSYGGQSEFCEQIGQVYGVVPMCENPTLFDELDR